LPQTHHLQAKAVIRLLNGNMLGSKMVSVVEKKTKEQLQEEQSRTLFIRNISGSLTIDDLEELVSQYCPVDSIFPLFGSDGSFSGTVCLVIHNEADLDGVIEYLNSVEHDGLSLECSAFDTTYKLKNQRNCYVKNIPLKWTDKEFLAYCSRFGEVDSAKLRENVQGKLTTQTGYVSYKSYEDAQRIIEECERDSYDRV
jgi:RNA-binding protein